MMIFFTVLVLCSITQISHSDAAPDSSYYKDLRLLSITRGISVQMNGTIFYVERKAYYGNNDQKMFLSLPDDGCPVSIQYGRYVFQPRRYSEIYQTIEGIPEFKLFTNSSKNLELLKIKDIQPSYLNLIKFLLQGNPRNVRICHDLKNQECSNGISIKYRTLFDFYRLLQNVSDYYEMSERDTHLFMIDNPEKLNKFCLKNGC